MFNLPLRRNNTLRSSPSRQDSTDSSGDPSLKDSDIGDTDVDVGGLDKMDKSGISRIFIDAVRFGRVLEDAADHAAGTLKPAAASPKLEETSVDDDARSVRCFADLVGKDLGRPDLLATERLAKISVNQWLSGDDGLDGISAEPEEAEAEETEGDVTEETEEDAKAKHVLEEEQAGHPIAHDVRPDRPLPARAESVTNLSSEEIVKLLIDEFGPLTTSDTDEEKLLEELEGAYFQDVAILGMIHLTTHRLTFHASLLSTRPDLLPDQQIIKKGPVTIHRAGLRRKRRVWLELSHDMVTTFPSGKEEDRIKPIRSLLLYSIKEVLPEDPQKPRCIKITVTSENGPYESEIEFDTKESAGDWRRELIGAVYLHRHRRAEYLGLQPEDDSNGVRISIPLSRVKSHACRNFLNMAKLLVIELTASEKQRSSMSLSSDSSDSEDDGLTSQSSLDEEADLSGRTLELCAMKDLHAWDLFDKFILEAKERELNRTKHVSSKVIVNFGALSFVERVEEVKRVEDVKERAIRDALSLQQESEIWYARSRISRGIASTGYFAITPHYVGFWTKCLSVSDEKYRFSVQKVIGAKPNFRYRFHTFGLILELKEHKNMAFDFLSQDLRDEAIRRITAAVAKSRSEASSTASLDGSQTQDQVTRSDTIFSTATSDSSASSATAVSATSVLSPLSLTIDRAKQRTFAVELIPSLPKVINLPPSVILKIAPRHFVCLTIGSRGDVQPYIALCLQLQKEGHRATIVTHEEYKEWVEGWGIQHRTAGGDPGALMKLSVEHKMFSPQFFKESLGNFRSWLDNLLIDAWEQCKDADVLLESPSAMAGVHIAEKLGIPYLRTFTMPWTKTSQFPHPFLSPPVDLASFNTSSYILFDNVFWSATSGQINRWRRNTLGIPSTDMGHMEQSKIPFIYNFSPSVVPKPMDWGDSNVLSGYWFLDNPDLGWQPPASLLEWMDTARKDQKPIVYIGFGSITVPNPAAMTRAIVKAVLKSDVRAIVSKGWSARMSKSDEPEVELPPECYSIDKVPHDWLFPQIDAALHHGGAGTTGASLRAGIPTLIKPWFGDQFFWASRVQALGAGLKVSSLNSSDLANALVKATSDRIMKERAASVGEKIRAENGIQTAIRSIYIYLDRAVRDRADKG